jgi:hypothetical protein
LFLKPYHRSDKTVGIHVIPLEIGRNVVQVLGYTNSNQLVAFLRIEASDRILVTKKVLGEDRPKSPPCNTSRTVHGATTDGELPFRE